MDHPLVIRRAAARFAAPCALLLASACAATSVQAQEGLIQQLEAMNQRIADPIDAARPLSLDLA
ncbi:hypothetical protein [Neomegalonema perideroedes]|uniref:hypothetical protein n=1 Tax=Neomegalonema perideroedes TaxID=217219 RepID=UPI0003714C5E|nr:hypothetical protein [Neomegalonema perideroedes]